MTGRGTYGTGGGSWSVGGRRGGGPAVGGGGGGRRRLRRGWLWGLIRTVWLVVKLLENVFHPSSSCLFSLVKFLNSRGCADQL